MKNFGILLWRTGPRYSRQIFSVGRPWGPLHSALEIWAPSPKIFGGEGGKDFGVGQPRGPWGRNSRGCAKTYDCIG